VFILLSISFFLGFNELIVYIHENVQESNLRVSQLLLLLLRVSKTQSNHWTKRMVNTRLPT